MRFSIDGNMSNEDGIYSFMKIDFYKISFLFQDHKTIAVLNYLIYTHLELMDFMKKINVYFPVHEQHVSRECNITIKDFRDSMNLLKKFQCIQFNNEGNDPVYECKFTW